MRILKALFRDNLEYGVFISLTGTYDDVFVEHKQQDWSENKPRCYISEFTRIPIGEIAYIVFPNTFARDFFYKYRKDIYWFNVSKKSHTVNFIIPVATLEEAEEIYSDVPMELIDTVRICQSSIQEYHRMLDELYPQCKKTDSLIPSIIILTKAPKHIVELFCGASKNLQVREYGDLTEIVLFSHNIKSSMKYELDIMTLAGETTVYIHCGRDPSFLEQLEIFFGEKEIVAD